MRCSILLFRETEGAPIVLEKLAVALEEPVFPLYLGRKSCPPALYAGAADTGRNVGPRFLPGRAGVDLPGTGGNHYRVRSFAIGKASRRALCLLFPFREAISHSVKYAGSLLRVLSLQASSGRKNNCFCHA